MKNIDQQIIQQIDPMAASSLPAVTTEFLGRVTVFTISSCRHCKRAKFFLEEHNVPFVEINLDQHPERRAEMIALTGKHTVPQIFFNEKHVGGADELVSLQPDSFRSLVEHARDYPADERSPLLCVSVRSPESNSLIHCEPDEYYQLMKRLHDADNGTEPVFRPGDRVHGFRTHPLSFTGRELVAWLSDIRVLDTTRSKAVDIGNELVQRLYIQPVSKKRRVFSDDDALYRLVTHGKARALNLASLAVCESPAPDMVGERIRRSILALYERYLSEDGQTVNYDGIRQSDEWSAFLQHTYELQRLDLSQLSREQTLSFFINVYNVLVIHTTIVRGVPTGLWKRFKFFSKNTYVIGGNAYSLNDIENGVLRGNSSPPFGWSKPFGPGDPRLRFALPSPDPRIHFALVCGAKSCPAIRTYSATHIDDELNSATNAFLDSGGIVMKKRHIYLSKIFDWYAADFGGSNRQILEWILDYLTPARQIQLRALLSSEQYTLSYLSYNWTSNGKKASL